MHINVHDPASLTYYGFATLEKIIGVEMALISAS